MIVCIFFCYFYDNIIVYDGKSCERGLVWQYIDFLKVMLVLSLHLLYKN